MKNQSCNTKIPFTLIKKYPFEYQVFLKNISDFLLFENIWKESEQGVDFQESLVIRTTHPRANFYDYD